MAMGMLSEKMVEDLRLRNRSEITQRCYLGCARRFVGYFDNRPPAKLGERELREFLLHLVEERGVSPATHHQHVAALRFLYTVTLRRPEAVAAIPYPKVPKRLPEIPSGSEVERLLSCITSVKYRAICSVAYAAGLRIHEACTLKVQDIDSARGLIHVREGKGKKARQVMLGERLLQQLREYWRIYHPKGEWLFPSNASPDRPVNVHTVRAALHQAAKAARLKRKVTPHLLRHSFATHMLEMGTDLRVIQMLLGHSSFRSTQRYAQLQANYLRRIKSPLDLLGKPEGQILR
jgi:site-specific recombinase XerD